VKWSVTIFLIAGLIVETGCKPKVTGPTRFPNGGTDTVSTVINGQKGISSFVIKAADNPGVLAYDVSGVVVFDTVKLIFKQGTDVSNLVPTITIVGKSIDPASGKAENFDSALTYTVTASDGSTLGYHVGVYFR
jgi:hypothetical protein